MKIPRKMPLPFCEILDNRVAMRAGPFADNKLFQKSRTRKAIAKIKIVEIR